MSQTTPHIELPGPATSWTTPQAELPTPMTSQTAPHMELPGPATSWTIPQVELPPPMTSQTTPQVELPPLMTSQATPQGELPTPAEIKTPQVTHRRPIETPQSKRRPQIKSPIRDTHRLPGLFITTRSPSTPRQASTVALPSTTQNRAASSSGHSHLATRKLSKDILEKFVGLIIKVSHADQSRPDRQGQLSVMERLEEALGPLADFVMKLDVKIQRSMMRPLFPVSFTSAIRQYDVSNYSCRTKKIIILSRKHCQLCVL